ncbi:DASH family cryptochrome [Oceanimonas sp. CHS3-5]|uniref:DASH family cryptochrome n=1 Tax=Oceanimonas sp. CHS3-5 TaxID=3068186 RepID=UPI00273D5B7D|nr:DASH family cryptochrome [Oceanimonas sp. CHS3-5]MDP5293259.1 DASH family cryptochrome [Oceanimonas sp. CHS3-5]
MRLLWLRNDLRLDDHAGWQRLADHHGETAAVYILPAHWRETDGNGLHRLGAARVAYLQQALADLRERLAPFPLTLLEGDPVDLLLAWHQVQPFELVTHAAQAPEEVNWLARLHDAGVNVQTFEVQPLFSPEQVEPLFSKFPASFTGFRKQVEKAPAWPVPAPQPAVNLGRLQAAACPLTTGIHWREISGEPAHPAWQGGESAAQTWLGHYLFEQKALAHYKASRNDLTGRYFSSHLSAALAWGCLSPRMVWHRILAYEQQWGSDEHSYWLKFELLWREYFHWSLRVHGRRLFLKGGLTGKAVPGAFNAEYWQAWCSASTGWPMIDAGLKELMATGFCSNRLRQNLASCFIHELGLDWRLGARFFEQHLVDFDVASNWGNWAYIAGAGHDPRRGRHFNPHRQWRQYDPKLTHLHQWLPELGPVTLKQVEAHQRGEQLLDYPAPLVPLD